MDINKHWRGWRFILKSESEVSFWSTFSDILRVCLRESVPTCDTKKKYIAPTMRWYKISTHSALVWLKKIAEILGHLSSCTGVKL